MMTKLEWRIPDAAIAIVPLDALPGLLPAFHQVLALLFGGPRLRLRLWLCES